MFCLGMAVYGDVICNSDTTLALFEDLIHFFWKMSWEQTRPKGSCRKQYLPKGLLKVISKLESWLSTTDQYPWWASSLVKKRECANS